MTSREAVEELESLFPNTIVTLGGATPAAVDIAKLVCSITDKMAKNEWTFVAPEQAQDFTYIFGHPHEEPKITTSQYLKLVALAHAHLQIDQFEQLNEDPNSEPEPHSDPSISFSLGPPSPQSTTPASIPFSFASSRPLSTTPRPSPQSIPFSFVPSTQSFSLGPSAGANLPVGFEWSNVRSSGGELHITYSPVFRQN